MLRWLLPVFSLALALPASAQWTLSPVRELGRPGGSIVAWDREATQGDRRVRITGVSFQDKDAVFQVIDNPPNARVPLSLALKSAGAVAGINGNYFHEDFTPLGLTVSNGTVHHAFERAKLLSGILTVQKGRIDLVRAGSQKAGPFEHALQAGPWLVERATPITGLNGEKAARRSLIATNGKGHWAIIALSSATLAEAAEILALPNLADTWTVRDALNLDGGSSTSLTASVGGKPVINIPSFGPVRNYLAISLRAQ